MSPFLITEADAAERLGISPHTLKKLRLSGTGPTHVRVGGQIRYTPEAITAYITDHSVSARPL